jgi:DNA mismatch repair protein MutL
MANMTIQLLDNKIISHIAAGEVVERPAAAVKELVENALDAGSTQITVEAQGGGIKLIRVTDNGCGIPAIEVALAFKRHSTSKINSMDDLDRITTLGFRGEALPSIAAVARVEMVTAVRGENAGTVIQLEDGAVVRQESRGHSPGTAVTVQDLFRKVPARLKFLKSEASENGRISEVVSRYALAFPEVRFTLMLEGKTVLHTPGSGRLIDAVIEVYGLEVARNMLELGNGPGSVHVSGLVGSPQVTRSTRDYINFFINRRWVGNRLLAWSVEEAYQGFLMQGKHPVAVINLSLPPDLVDVNIHPAKTEVKFQDERQIFGAVQKAIRQALVKQTPVPRIEEPGVKFTAFSGASPSTGPDLFTAHKESAALPVPAPTPLMALPLLRVLGQIAGTYIVAEGADGLYLIDQHAAHERILFEILNKQRSVRQPEIQGLLPPATLEVDPRQETMLQTVLGDLSEFGFAVEPFGTRTYLVRSIPAALKDRDWAAALREILDTSSGGEWSSKIAVSLACHSAIRAGKIMNVAEMNELIRQLERVAVPNTCPHGRPTMIHLDLQQMEKEFRRK